MARILGEAMSKGLGQRVIVEAKPGAAGVLASETLTRAAPDGYTLLMLTAAHATTANLSRIKYDPVDDFAMLTTIGFYPYAIAVRADHPSRASRIMIAARRQSPAQITYTSVGVGSVPHLTGELLARAGVKLTHVPYRGGIGPITDVLGGRVDLLLDTQTVSAPHITSGTARGLAVTSEAPWPGVPGVPTVAATLPRFESKPGSSRDGEGHAGANSGAVAQGGCRRAEIAGAACEAQRPRRRRAPGYAGGDAHAGAGRDRACGKTSRRRA